VENCERDEKIGKKIELACFLSQFEAGIGLGQRVKGL
jgi:hypothetical protein